MTEAELDMDVRELARVLGLYRYHPYDSRRSEAGWPDWVIIGPKGILFRENKTERGRLTPQQTAVGYMLRGIGLDWDVWRPRDWLSGRIRQEMEALR